MLCFFLVDCAAMHHFDKTFNFCINNVLMLEYLRPVLYSVVMKPVKYNVVKMSCRFKL